MAEELSKYEKPKKTKKHYFTFKIPEDVLKEMKEYAAKYNMSLGRYIEAVHKRYLESIQKK